jgi:hypothetical protein
MLLIGWVSASIDGACLVHVLVATTVEWFADESTSVFSGGV